MRCATCRTVNASDRLCHYCRETVRLIRFGLCVWCKAPIVRASDRTEGKCAECAARNTRLSPPIQKLLRQAAAVRAKAA